ncbi:hypothetical protein SBADM41S_01142 [Streptomyces badius]
MARWPSCFTSNAQRSSTVADGSGPGVASIGSILGSPQQQEGQEALRFFAAAFFDVFLDVVDFFDAAVFFAGVFLAVFLDGRHLVHGGVLAVVAARFLRGLHGGVQGCHQVDDLALVLLPVVGRGREGLALRLRRDDVLQGLAVLVVEAGQVLDRHPLGQLHGLLDLLLSDLDLARGQLLRTADLVGPLHGVQHDRSFADPEQAQALAAVPRELRHRHFRGPFQGLAEQGVGLGGDLPVGGQVVGGADADRIDRAGVDERDDLDRLRRRQRHLLQFLVRHRDRLILRDLVALADLILGHHLAVELADLPRPHPPHVRQVHPVEVDIMILSRGHDLHRNCHQPETDRTGPQRSRHLFHLQDPAPLCSEGEAGEPRSKRPGCSVVLPILTRSRDVRIPTMGGHAVRELPR